MCRFNIRSIGCVCYLEGIAANAAFSCEICSECKKSITSSSILCVKWDNEIIVSLSLAAPLG